MFFHFTDPLARHDSPYFLMRTDTLDGSGDLEMIGILNLSRLNIEIIKTYL